MNEHPLTQTLARISQITDYFKSQLGVTQTAGWVEPTALFAPSSGKLRELRADAQKLLKTKSHNIIGSTLLQGYHWPIIVAPIGCYLLDKRAPDLALDNLRVRLGEEGGVEQIALVAGRFAALPDDPAASHPDAYVVPDVDALREHLRTSLEAHLGWVIEQLGMQVGTKPRGLWLDVADRCASTLIWLMQEIAANVAIADIEREIDALLRVSDSPLNHKKVGLFTLNYDGKTKAFLDRASCCYWYRMEDANGDCCTTCPRRPREERNERLLQYMAEILKR